MTGWQIEAQGNCISPSGVTVVCPFSWNVKQASWLPPLPQTLWIQCDIMPSVPSSSDCFVRRWMWPLFCSFVDISLSLGGISLPPPQHLTRCGNHFWQHPDPTKSHSGGLCCYSEGFPVMDRKLDSPRSQPFHLKMCLLLTLVALLHSKAVFRYSRMRYPGQPVVLSLSVECFSFWDIINPTHAG